MWKLATTTEYYSDHGERTGRVIGADDLADDIDIPEIVRQTSHTVEEAARAHAEIAAMVRSAKITKRSGATSKAHVLRRTA